MTKPKTVLPLSGGDYVDEGNGPKPFKPAAEKPAKHAPAEKSAKPAPSKP